MVVHVFVTSKLDYCNSLVYALPKFLIAKLQSVQNSAARLVCMTRKFGHITPILIDLHWLPIKACFHMIAHDRRSQKVLRSYGNTLLRSSAMVCDPAIIWKPKFCDRNVSYNIFNSDR